MISLQFEFHIQKDKSVKTSEKNMIEQLLFNQNEIYKTVVILIKQIFIYSIDGMNLELGSRFHI
jgi:hypothetical protein